MKRFRFRLERVLQYRKLVKDEKTRELIERRNKLYEDAERLKDLETAALLNRLEENVYVTAEQVQLLGMYGARLKEAIAQQEEQVERSQEAVAVAHGEYVEAAKEEASLATLRTRKQAEYQEYVEHEDGKFLDELSVQRQGYLRKKEMDR